MYRLTLMIISVFALLPSPAWAKDSPAAMWVVSQLSGDARVLRNGLQPAALKANVQLAPGDMVVTGATGRATLLHGADYIVIAPRSELRLPTASQPTGFTRVIQNLGTMLFKVQHTGVPHFAVDTPMLAAVVKGTTFTIVVTKDRSAVQVLKGVVQVTAAEGGMTRLVEGGRTIFVNRADPTRLLDAQSPSAATPTSGAVRVTGTTTPSVATIAALTEGLVRPETGSPSGSQTATAAPAAVIKPVEIASAQPPVTEQATDVASTDSPVTQPVADAVDTVVPTVTEPVTEVVTAVVMPVTDVVDTVVAPVTEVVNTVVTPVIDVVDTAVAPVVGVVAPVVAPVVDVVASVVAPVIDVVAPVVAPVIDVVAPVVAPILAPILNLFG